MGHAKPSPRFFNEQERVMREIKFRGKSLTSGKWIYGSLYNDGAEDYILPNLPQTAYDYEDYQVDLNTICQYTGLKDKNGKEIWEHDVFNIGDSKIQYVVVWKDLLLCGKQIGTKTYIGLDFWIENIEVAGNIHDNPELIKTKQ